MYESDFLILGSGIAGLMAARKLAKFGTVHVVTKKQAVESNTNYAQGGIAAVVSRTDSFESHVQDTLTAGAGLCREDIVRLTVEEGPARIRELIEIGVRFSERDDKLDLGLEGGHSQRRVLHAGDLTGREIERALIESVRADPNIKLFENHVAVDLIMEKHPGETPAEHNRAVGAWALDPEGTVRAYSAKAVILATGGAGKVYLYTSNPDIATGDGMAMAYRAGATLANLEFVQFHPTCLFHPEAKSFLLSEALRGEGGLLRLKDGTRFMEKVHPLKELAPRDIVARAIDAELKRTGDECVYLDMTAQPKGFLLTRFPNLYESVKQFGIDMAHEPIPVVPAAHFFCGGVLVDANGRTEVPGLYAVGEVSHTGLHGANRLASNSLLEGCVFAHRAVEHLKEGWPELKKRKIPAPPRWNPGKAVPSEEAVVITQNWDEIRRLMWNYVGIVRTNKRLERAKSRMELLNDEIAKYYWDFLLTRDLIELRNIACIAELIIRCASARHESRGLHYTLDYPEAKDSERHDTRVNRYRRVTRSAARSAASQPL
ncbi:MAG: L-aspartate oxidase [Elusimicrobia bacterium]|nr:L-aspartate oxidase [Elusimicrobiota bacterium]